MPSVGMRRTTRVFGVVKGADGARVLRSGRRLWPESGETKLRRPSDGDDWLKIVNGGKGDGGLGYEPKGWIHHDSPKKNRTLAAIEVFKPIEKAGLDNGHVSDKRFGLVYTRRKRKSLQAKISDFPANSEAKDGSEKKMYGRQFVRRQRRKISSGEYLAVAENVELKVDYWPRRVVTVVVESSLARRYWTARFLISVLMYMTRSRLRLTELFAFLSSEPICSVNSSFGIFCFLDHHSNKSSGICKFFGATKFVPLFRVDFSAIPTCFVDMHSSMFFRFKCQPNLLVNNASDDVMVDDDEDDWSFLPKDDFLECRALMNAESSHTENRGVSQLPIRPSKLGIRSNQYRNGLISRGFQKRRSSLRRRRARNPSPNGVHKSNGALVSDLVSFRKNGASSNKLRRSVRSSSAGHLKEVSPAKVGVKQDVDSSDCCANILVIESEKCYREELVNVMLELSPLGEWLLVIKKDGSTRYTHKAEIMRPCSFNRFTHAAIWTGDDGWKLEFPNKKDWNVFKDLYKDCSDRNVPTSGVKIIPVPAVSEVSENGHNHSTPFCRPDSYISVKDDEVSRAMAKRTANYDMDSEDEEWLKKFNSEFFAENEILEHISEDRFELMFDSFEKAFYCSSIDMSDEKPASTLCPNVSRRDVVEAIYGYWTKKRKQKRSSLLRVFQAHQVKRAPLIPKAFLRKKRSFKRQPSQIGRGKQPSFLQAFAAEKDTKEEQNSLLNVVEAKSSANKFTELAVCKRRQAQLLMQNADLATYKATMALKIAEAASLPDANSADAAAAADLLD